MMRSLREKCRPLEVLGRHQKSHFSHLKHSIHVCMNAINTKGIESLLENKKRLTDTSARCVQW